MWKWKKIDEFYKTTYSVGVKNVTETILMIPLVTYCQIVTAVHSKRDRSWVRGEAEGYSLAFSPHCQSNGISLSESPFSG